MKKFWALVLTLGVFTFIATANDDHSRDRRDLKMLWHWNQLAIDASGRDHSPELRQHLGPGRASRAVAMVNIAMFDAVNADKQKYNSYTGVQASRGPFSIEAAIAQAAHDTLVSLFSAQSAQLNGYLAEDLNGIQNRHARANGIDLGRRVAAALLAMREHDGSDHAEPVIGVDWTTSDQPGHWRMDPISQIPVALGGRWHKCAPFVIESSHQFRCPPPPPMESEAYAIAFDEVKRLGAIDSTERTVDQTIAGIYWAYDGTPSLCAPPRLYNQITIHIAKQMGSDLLETARLLALVNIALSDATLTVWESKFHYDFWRPVTGIREADPGTGPTGLGDGNDATIGDPDWSPLAAPASNLSDGVDFTPPFPAYPSGHAGMGGALFQTLRRFYGTDDVQFTLVSDELNGITKDSTGLIRPLVPRTFQSFSQAEEENGQSRIYLGIHWSFDKTAAIAIGRKVADYVFDHAFTPAPPRR